MVEVVSFLLNKRENWHPCSSLTDFYHLQILSIVFACSETNDVQCSKDIGYSISFT